MIRIDCACLAVQPMDMRAGTDTALGGVVQVFVAAHPHHAYLFASRRAKRLSCSCMTALAGQRAAAVLSLIQSAKIDGHDPYACMKDIFTRLPTQKNRQSEKLLPHRWWPV